MSYTSAFFRASSPTPLVVANRPANMTNVPADFGWAAKGWKKIPRLRNLVKKKAAAIRNGHGPMHPTGCKCWQCTPQEVFTRRLRNHGFKLLGSGAFSAVYGKDGSNRVLKVTTARDNWYDYVTWARDAGWAGKYAPMVYSYKKVKFQGEEFYLASMERMNTTIGRLREKDSPSFLMPLITYHIGGNPLAKEVLTGYNAELCQFLDDFKEKFSDQGRFDLHGGNMMVRDDMSFCLTDPVCGKGSTEYRRLRERELSQPLINLIRGLFESSIRH